MHVICKHLCVKAQDGRKASRPRSSSPLGNRRALGFARDDVATAQTRVLHHLVSEELRQTFGGADGSGLLLAVVFQLPGHGAIFRNQLEELGVRHVRCLDSETHRSVQVRKYTRRKTDFQSMNQSPAHPEEFSGIRVIDNIHNMLTQYATVASSYPTLPCCTARPASSRPLWRPRRRLPPGWCL